MRNVRLLGILSLIVAVGLAILIVKMQFDVQPVTIPSTSAPEGTADIRAAFSRPDDATDPEIAEFFTKLATVIAGRDGVAGADLFDPDRLYREAFRTPDRDGDDLTPTDPRGPVAVLEGVWDGFTAGWLGSGWTETRLRRIDPLPGGAEVVVYAKHRTASGVIPARWWLIRREGVWRVYDLEDVRVGLRLSHQVAALAAIRLDDQQRAAVKSALNAISAASTALASGDVAAADQALVPARTAPLPRPQRAVLCLTEAAIALESNDPAAALDWANQADQAHAGLPGTDLVRAVAYYRQRKWSEAEATARRYVELLGPDARASLVLGLSLLELNRWDEAAEVLRAAAAENPGQAALSDALRRATAPR